MSRRTTTHVMSNGALWANVLDRLSAGRHFFLVTKCTVDGSKVSQFSFERSIVEASILYGLPSAWYGIIWFIRRGLVRQNSNIGGGEECFIQETIYMEVRVSRLKCAADICSTPIWHADQHTKAGLIWKAGLHTSKMGTGTGPCKPVGVMLK